MIKLDLQKFAASGTYMTNYFRNGTGTPSSINPDWRYRFIVSETVNYSNNTSTVYITGYMQITVPVTVTSWSTSAVASFTSQIEGISTKTSSTVAIPTLSGGEALQLELGTISHVVTHNADGNKSIRWRGIGNFSGTSTTLSTGYKNYNLIPIPKGTVITELVITPTINGCGFALSTADAVDWIQHSLDGSDWINSDDQIISGLQPNTNHNLKVRVRRTSNGVWTSSDLRYFTTKDMARLVTVPSNIDTDTPFEITFNHNNNNYVFAAIYDTNGSVAFAPYRAVYGSSHNFTLTELEKVAFYNNMKTVKPKKYRLYLRTTTFDGLNYGEYREITVNIINADPTFTNFTFENTNKALPSGINERTLTGSATKFIKGYSDLKATITGSNLAVAQKGADLKDYKLEIQGMGVIQQAPSSNVQLTQTNITSELIKVIATDTRDNFKAVDKTATMVNYAPMTINNITLARDGGINAATKLSLNGTFWNSSFGSVTNNVVITYKYKLSSASSWTTGITTITPTKSGNNFSVTNLAIRGDIVAGFTITDGFDVQILIEDKVIKETLQIVLNSGTPNISLHKNGGTSFGRPYNVLEGGTVQVDGKNLLNWFYPIGSIYETTSGNLDTIAKMNTHFGGTWEEFGKGRVLVAVNESDTPLNASNKTGGSTNPLSAHNHGINYVYPFVAGGNGIYLPATNQTAPTGVATGAVQQAGSNTDHANWQPFITAYRYRRVS